MARIETRNISKQKESNQVGWELGAALLSSSSSWQRGRWEKSSNVRNLFQKKNTSMNIQKRIVGWLEENRKQYSNVYKQIWGRWGSVHSVHTSRGRGAAEEFRKLVITPRTSPSIKAEKDSFRTSHLKYWMHNFFVTSEQGQIKSLDQANPKLVFLFVRITSWK